MSMGGNRAGRYVPGGVTVARACGRAAGLATTGPFANNNIISLDLHHHQQQQIAIHPNATGPAKIAGDRFENAADYSQLLRSFGELSGELVDLGLCCLLAKQETCSPARLNPAAAPAAAPLSDNNFISTARQRPLYGGGGGDRSLVRLLDANNENSASKFEWPAQVGPNCVLRELESLAVHELTRVLGCSTASKSAANNLLQFARHKILDTYLRSKTQDLRNLFNVNRLTIDRSILLLLSASKCCLRQGRECLRGLEARESIMGQTRASISIIMAVVKLSIFCLGPFELLHDLEPWQLQQQQHQQQPSPSPFALNRQLQVQLHLEQPAPSNPAHFNPSAPAPSNSNQFQHQHQHEQYLLHQAASDRDENNQDESCSSSSCQNDNYSAASNFSDVDSEFNQLFINSGGRGQPAAPQQLAKKQQILTTFNGALDRLTRFGRSAHWKQQIMDHFLLGAGPSASISAFDAIDRLQLLMGPFGRVSDHKGLASALNDTFEMFRWFNEQALNDCRREHCQREAQDGHRWSGAATGSNCGGGGAGGGPAAGVASASDNSCPASAARCGGLSTTDNNLTTNREVINEESDNDSPSGIHLGQHLARQAAPASLQMTTFDNGQPVNTFRDPAFDQLQQNRKHFNAQATANIINNNPNRYHQNHPSTLRQECCGSSAMSCLDDATGDHLELGRQSQQQQLQAEQSPQASEYIAASCATSDASIMDKRQLIDALTNTFLGQLRISLVERVHEFTDCAYTKHENRETIIQLVQCIKLQLNKLVKLLYRTRRRPASVNEINLAMIQHLATQFEETCVELKLELNTVVIEQSDELDRTNLDIDLVKQLKQQTLVGDCAKTDKVCVQFQEQNERLVELCKMLNQVASTNKMKMTTKTLATWFELNTPQLLATAQCLSREPRSKVLKDHLWAYIQVWCSFYDDFCQLARQTAYLVHRQFNPARASRIGHLRQQIRNSRNQRSNLTNFSPSFSPGNNSDYLIKCGPMRHLNATTSNQSSRLAGQQTLSGLSSSQPIESMRPYAPQGKLSRDTESHTSLAAVMAAANYRPGRANATSESPRSLDHYYGFGSNYHQILGRTATGQASSEAAAAGGTCTVADMFEFGNVAEQLKRQATLIQPSQQQQQPQPQPHSGPVCPQPAWPDNLKHQMEPNVAPMYQFGTNSASYSILSPQVNKQQQQQQLYQFDGDDPSLARAQNVYATQHSTNYIEASSANNLAMNQLHQQQQHHQTTTFDGRTVQFDTDSPIVMNQNELMLRDQQQQQPGEQGRPRSRSKSKHRRPHKGQRAAIEQTSANSAGCKSKPERLADDQMSSEADLDEPEIGGGGGNGAGAGLDHQSAGDSEEDEILRGAKETAQMATSMYQFIRGEGELNTTQDLFTQAELFAEEANELYKEVRRFSYKVPSGDLKRDLLTQLSSIPALVQQLQFVVKGSTVGNAATFAKVDSIISETRSLMEAVNRVVNATMSCKQQYNMTVASRKRTRTLSPAYRSERGSLDFDGFSSRQTGGMGRQIGGGAGMGSEPDI